MGRMEVRRKGSGEGGREERGREEEGKREGGKEEGGGALQTPGFIHT